MATTLWTYRTDIHRPDTSLEGFDVAATDGDIGKVDEDTTDRDHLVVDTGFWIFGKKRLLPAGVVTGIDYDNERVHVDMTKDEIKEAPDYDDTVDRDGPGWDREPFGTYYAPHGW